MRAYRCCVSCVAVALLTMIALPAPAQDGNDEARTLKTARSSKWGFFVAPYGWLTGVSGTVVTDGEAIEIDVPFEDFFANTRAGLQLYFEARRNRLFVAFDGTWATLGAEHEGRLFDIDLEVRQRIYDVRLGFEVVNKERGDVIHKPQFDWQRRGIVDVYIGGFGIGDAARFSWQAGAELGFRVSKRAAVIAGYRILEYDTIAGDGEDRNGTDLRQQGPIIGAGIKF